MSTWEIRLIGIEHDFPLYKRYYKMFLVFDPACKERNKPGGERQIPYDLTYKWNLINKTNKQAKYERHLS